MSSKGTHHRELMRWIQEYLEDLGRFVEELTKLAWRLTKLAWRVEGLLFIAMLSVGPLYHAAESFAPKILHLIPSNASSGVGPEPKETVVAVSDYSDMWKLAAGVLTSFRQQSSQKRSPNYKQRGESLKLGHFGARIAEKIPQAPVENRYPQSFPRIIFDGRPYKQEIPWLAKLPAPASRPLSLRTR